MSFFNEKWKNSSIVTKASAWILTFVALLFLVTVFIIQSWNSSLDGALDGYAILYLIFFAIYGLLAFGIFKVNQIARGLMILGSISCLISVILSFAVVGYIMDYAKAATRQAVVDTVGEDTVRAAVTAGAMAGHVAGAANFLADNAAEAAGAMAGHVAGAANFLADNTAASALAAQAASQVQASGIIGIIVKAIINAIPASVLATIGFYLFVFLSPMYLIVLSGLLLIFCGKDFKRRKKEEQPVAA